LYPYYHVFIGNHLVDQWQIILGSILLLAVEFETILDSEFLVFVFVVVMVLLLLLLRQQLEVCLFTQSLCQVGVGSCELGILQLLESDLVNKVKQELELNGRARGAVI
jgi:hypothetical protein